MKVVCFEQVWYEWVVMNVVCFEWSVMSGLL